jgi:hypothetical protein
MKNKRRSISFAVLLIIIAVSLICPQTDTLTPPAHAKEITSKHKIIADTLAAHKVTCLSRNGSIKTVFLDGEWLDVRNVEVVDRTLIITTDFGTLSLAAVINSP